MNALFIGRFQPFHLGHMHVITTMISRYQTLYIGVGSSQYHHTYQNPFSFLERKTMINKTLESEGITNYSIIAIPDIHNPPQWVDHISSILSDFTEVITNNKDTAILFQQKGFSVHQTGFFNKKNYSGEEIRNRMKQNQPWQDLVPSKVYDYLCSINAEKRLQTH